MGMRQWFAALACLSLAACSAQVDQGSVQAQSGQPTAAQVAVVSIPYDPNLPRYVVTVQPFTLAAEGSDVRYLAVYDAERGEVALRHLSGDRASGRDFELWLIEGSAAPVSIGLIPAGSTVRLPVTPKAKLGSGDVLAVSVEPAGGSPTGQPTGPVVALGDLTSI